MRLKNVWIVPIGPQGSEGMAGDYVRGYVRDSAVGMVTKLTINLGLLGLLRCFVEKVSIVAILHFLAHFGTFCYFL